MNNSEYSLAELEDIIKEVLESGGEFELFPKGVSMLPLIHQGRDSVILVKPKGMLTVGDIAFYKRPNGQFVLHRVIAAKDGVYTMCGDNQITKECGVLHGSVIGVVDYLIINGKRVDSSTPSYRRYVKRRQNLKIRRVLLFLYRRNPFVKKALQAQRAEK